MRRCSDFFLPHALAVAAAVVCVAPAMAQNTTAAVSGQVVGADGKPVVGAAVTIVHRDSGTTARATTDAQGRYVARGLRVGGPYTITVAKDGTTDQRSELFFGLSDVALVDLQLQSAQRIEVTGRSLRFLDANSMGATTQISSRDLATQASISGNLQDFARFDPRISQTDKERGEISALGQNSRYNAITIDGVRISDTFGLEANNLPTAKQPVPLDAIQSVQVNISNYDVAQAGYTGANVNAVTKSGANQFTGSARYALRDEGFVGDRFNRTDGTFSPNSPFTDSTRVLTFGGPIVKDKLFFFLSHESLKNARSAEFAPLGGGVANVGLSTAFINSVRDVARNTHGIDIGEFDGSATGIEVKDTMLRLDWNISDAHRAYLRYSTTNQDEQIAPNFGTRSLALSSHWYTQKKKFDTLVAQLFSDWTNDLSTEIKLSRRDYDSAPVNNSRLPFMAVNLGGPLPAGTPASVLGGTRTLNFGTERSRHFNELATDTTDLYLGANYKVGAHDIKGGAEISRNSIFNAFLQDTQGNYSFQCINSSQAFTYTFGAVNCATASAAVVEQAVLENFRRGRPSGYQYQFPVAGLAKDDAAARWKLGNDAVFLQDNWKLNKDVNLMFGVRVDQLKMSEQQAFNANAAAVPVNGVLGTPPGTGGPGTAPTRALGGFGYDNTVTPSGTSLVQPRAGFNWTLRNLLSADLRGQVRGGLGLFQGAAANVWLSNPYSNNGLETQIVACGVTGFSSCPPTEFFSPNPDQQPTNFGAGRANVDFLAEGVRQPAVWKFNLAFEHELPWGGITAGAEVVHTKTKNAIYFQHLNLGVPTLVGTADDRDLFHNPQGFNPVCWNPTTGAEISSNTAGNPCNVPQGQSRSRAASNAAYNNVLRAVNTEQGGGTAVTLAFARPANEGLSWNVAYTRTTAKEVSPLTSSVSNSNWAARSVFNPNEEVSANSAYLIRDRVNAGFNWRQQLGGDGYQTSVGIFYEGRRGRPYSWTFNNDMNGDGLAGNDLLYIPRGSGSNEVVFAATTQSGAIPAYTAAQNEARFWEVVDANPALSSARGGVVKRNSAFAPFVNTFDLRIAQEIPGFAKDHKMTFAFNILNFGNMLNNRWGRVDEIGFQGNGGQARSFVNFAGLDPQGRYIYGVSGTVEDFVTKQARNESQWAMQLSLKYDF
jgi:hypothetical protein